jgi:hypothetical protein
MRRSDLVDPQTTVGAKGLTLRLVAEAGRARGSAQVMQSSRVCRRPQLIYTGSSVLRGRYHEHWMNMMFLGNPMKKAAILGTSLRT